MTSVSETWYLNLRAETWNLRPPNGPPVGPPKIISQKVNESYFPHSETFTPSKLIIFHQGIRFSRSRGPEEAKMTNLSPLASRKLKLMPILFFLGFEVVPLYPGPKNPPNHDFKLYKVWVEGPRIWHLNKWMKRPAKCTITLLRTPITRAPAPEPGLWSPTSRDPSLITPY